MLVPSAALAAAAFAVALASSAPGPSIRCVPSGDVATMTDANGLVTTMTYDERGRLKTSSAGAETTLVSATRVLLVSSLSKTNPLPERME